MFKEADVGITLIVFDAPPLPLSAYTFIFL